MHMGYICKTHQFIEYLNWHLDRHRSKIVLDQQIMLPAHFNMLVYADGEINLQALNKSHRNPVLNKSYIYGNKELKLLGHVHSATSSSAVNTG